MALRAGYKGIKKYIADKLNRMNPDDSFATDAEIAEKADISALGTQEGATASRLYHPGEHFYKNGKFCTVKGSGNVAQGATWTLNTNYTAGDVASELLPFTSINLTSSTDVTFDGENKLYINGKIAIANIKGTITDVSADTNKIISYVGSIKPSITRYSVGYDIDTGISVMLFIDNGGNICVRSHTAFETLRVRGELIWNY